MRDSDKEEVEGLFDLKTSRNSIMYTIFHSNITDFAGNLE